MLIASASGVPPSFRILTMSARIAATTLKLGDNTDIAGEVGYLPTIRCDFKPAKWSQLAFFIVYPTNTKEYIITMQNDHTERDPEAPNTNLVTGLPDLSTFDGITTRHKKCRSPRTTKKLGTVSISSEGERHEKFKIFTTNCSSEISHDYREMTKIARASKNKDSDYHRQLQVATTKV